MYESSIVGFEVSRLAMAATGRSDWISTVPSKPDTGKGKTV